MLLERCVCPDYELQRSSYKLKIFYILWQIRQFIQIWCTLIKFVDFTYKVQESKILTEFRQVCDNKVDLTSDEGNLKFL